MTYYMVTEYVPLGFGNTPQSTVSQGLVEVSGASTVTDRTVSVLSVIVGDNDADLPGQEYSGQDYVDSGSGQAVLSNLAGPGELDTDVDYGSGSANGVDFGPDLSDLVGPGEGEEGSGGVLVDVEEDEQASDGNSYDVLGFLEIFGQVGVQ